MDIFEKQERRDIWQRTNMVLLVNFYSLVQPGASLLKKTESGTDESLGDTIPHSGGEIPDPP